MNTNLLKDAGPDATLQQVVSHWLPRMQVAGLPPNLIARLIQRSGTWENWCHIWSDEALLMEKRGVHAERQGRTITAGEYYFRSSLLYHFAQFMFFDDLAQKQTASERKYIVYQSAAVNLSPPAISLEVPYKGYSLKGYLRKAGLEASNLVVIIPGTDSSKEEYTTLQDHFLNRGLSTFIFDGPGQGEGRECGPLTPEDWPSVIETIIQTLRDSGVNGNIGMMGVELGGHLALHASSVPGISAIISMNGFFNLADFWETLPDIYRSNIHFALGCETMEKTKFQAQKFSLRDVAPPDCPLFAMHGGRDEIFPVSDAQTIIPWSHGKAQLQIFQEGIHVCNNVDYLWRPLAADWFVEKLI